MRFLKSNIQIAIDGPVAAGKGTISKLLAEHLNMLYVDTGAMYRAVAYFIKEAGVDFEAEDEICQLLEAKQPIVTLRTPQDKERDGRLVTTLLYGEDISWKIRTEDISRGVSIVTAYKCVRDYLVPQQQNLANSTNVVMEGRDITTRVLPHADLKIYLDASENVRAQRRYEQLLTKGELTTLEQVKKDLQERDYKDMNREIDPLTKSEDAWVLDTSDLDIAQTIETVCQKLREKKLIE